MRKQALFMLGILIIAVVAQPAVYGATFSATTNTFQGSSPTFSDIYSSGSGGEVVGIGDVWPILEDMENGQCDATSDFLVAIRPGSCEPMVVRSDLLEEQNVPVFCQLDAVKVNPLIKVSSIRSISFKGDYPSGVVGVSFHPAQAAIKSYDTLLGSPLINNIGYVVIILKRNAVEDDMPDWISGNLTATLHYDADEAFGTGKAEYYLPLIDDSAWDNEYKDYGFWYGKGFVRLESMGDGSARIGLYTDGDDLFREVVLDEGETSGEIYFPGFYCNAGLKVKLNKVVAPEEQARLNIDGSEVWVRKGSKILDGGCTVSDLAVLEDGTGSVLISCPGQKLSLLLERFGAEFSVGEKQLGDFVISGKIGDDEGNWYVGYVGKIPETVGGNGGEEFVLLASSDGEIESEDLGKISSNVAEVYNSFKQVDYDAFKKQLGKTGFFSKQKVKVLLAGNSVDVSGKGLTFNGLSSKTVDEDYTGDRGDLLDEYFEKGNDVVKDLVSSYPSEMNNAGEKYGEAVLIEQISLAGQIGKQATKKDLIELFLEEYPDSDYADRMKYELRALNYYNFDKSYSTVFVNNNYHYLSVDKFEDVDEGKKIARVSVSGEWGDFSEGGIIFENATVKIVVGEVEPNSVKIVYNSRKSGKDKWSSKTSSLKKEESVNYAGKEIVLRDIEVDEVAYVSLIPEVKRTTSEADFTFKIGIEKRAIELSPERAQKMIDNLEETIEEWGEINDKLGNLISGWKGACFATSALLMFKAAVSGFSGEAMARKKVMEHYREICAADEAYSSNTECYNALADEINSDVEKLSEVYSKVNDRMDPILERNDNDAGLFGIDKSVVDNDDYVGDLKSDLGGGTKVIVETPEGVKEYEVNDATSPSQLRAVYAWGEVKDLPDDSIVKKVVKSELDASWRSVYIVEKNNALKESLKNDYGADVEVADLRENLKSVTWTGTRYDDLGRLTSGEGMLDTSGFSDDKPLNMLTSEDNPPAQVVNFNGKEYVLLLGEGKSGKMSVLKAYELETGGSYVASDEKVVEAINKKYSFIDGGECSNIFKEPKVKYYKAGNLKGKPAIVPFDLKKGWYAKIPGSQGTLVDGVQGYTDAGDVSYFKICNVGVDGKENNGEGDDFCQSFDVNNYNKVDGFGGCYSLSGSDVQKLAQEARQAIKDAQRNYGGSVVSILGENIEVGGEVADVPGYECQDFFSPEECLFMFNVCDPVICPASRCNLGGELTVSNVVQSGIIGSLLLCLPNAKEGIMVPVCLTGVHAGIDSLIDIMESEKECLEKSIETGEHVGICDEITSIYLCEFFWRQLAPVMDIIIPKIIELAYGGGNQGTRGGGEYLTVQYAWDSLEDSISYFKDSYAQNAFRAFQFKNVQEAGGEFCRAFVGTSLPGSADAIDDLLEPESPGQFTAWFDEIPYSEATVPATSQYKVYYHIYAGNDRGAQYSVYLSDPPASSYYASNPEILVDAGYVAAGEHVDETEDFTAPEGYKELCVDINGQKKCGFGKVSTSFLVDYVSSKYVEGQVEKTDITKEEECISGSRSLWGAVNPNLQAGFEDAVNPEIALDGIVRICATYNPGSSVNDSRWVDVGYCDNADVRCWLDTESVKDDLNLVAAVENKSASDLLEESSKLETGAYADVKEELKRIEGKIKNLEIVLTEDKLTSSGIDGAIRDIISDLDKIVEPAAGVGYPNEDRALALVYKARVYRIVVKKLKERGVDKVVPTRENVAEAQKGGGDDGDEAGGDEDGDDGGDGVYVSGAKESIIGDKEVVKEGTLYVVELDAGKYGINEDDELVYYSEDDGWIEKSDSRFGYDEKSKEEKDWVDGIEFELFARKTDVESGNGGGVGGADVTQSPAEEEGDYQVGEGGERLSDIIDVSTCSILDVQQENPDLDIDEGWNSIISGGYLVLPHGCELKWKDPAEPREVNQIELVYTEGLDDQFFFRWNEKLQRVEVLMNLNYRGLLGTHYGWTWQIGLNEEFDNGDDVMDYTIDDVREILDQPTWEDTISAAYQAEYDNARKVELKKYEGDDLGWVYD